jgi:methyl-accepting chemotaxis protein/methyl-accepting chemotaxis protein-1 (serine sensor receptor)
MKSGMTIGKKFTLVSGILVLLAVVLGVVSLLGLARISQSVKVLSSDGLDGVISTSKMESALFQIRGDILEHIGSTDPAQMAALEADIAKLKQEIDADLADVGASVYDSQEREVIAKIVPAIQGYYSHWDAILPLSRASKNEEAYKLYLDAAASFTAARDAVHAETEFNRQLGKTMTADADSAQTRARWMTWLVLAIAALSGIGLTFFMMRGVNRVLTQAVEELSEGAVQMASAAGQVASSSQGLAQGSSQQAATLEQTSAAASEINSMAGKNTENTRAAAGLVAQSLAGFTQTNQSLAEMIEAMDHIAEASGKIAKIIKVIDEISFQTNILALNAAVEAARAGESGLGFAVVADEVRNLAQRCAQAAKDTAGMIEESVSTSNDGKAKLEQVVEGIHTIGEHASKVKVLIDEVNQSSLEQAKGINQVAQATAQMQQVTQNTAASAEEGAAASEQLTAQSQTLKEVVERLNAMV